MITSGTERDNHGDRAFTGYIIIDVAHYGQPPMNRADAKINQLLRCSTNRAIFRGNQCQW